MGTTIERVRVGDWVSGTSLDDEKVIGFVLTLKESGSVKIRVTQSDRSEAVGTKVDAYLPKIKRMTDTAPSTDEELQNLIELALATHDKEWFDALSAKLAQLSPASADSASAAGRPSRIGPASRI